MAVEVATAYVSIVPSARGFTRLLRNEIGDLDGFGRGVGADAGGGFASGFGSHFKGMALAMGAAFVGAIAVDKLFDLGGKAFTIAADFEVTQTAFEGLLGGTGPAEALLDELRDFAAQTPFEFPQLADAARKLLAFGFTAEEIVPVMQKIGDAAAAVGASDTDINLVVRALGQIGSKGRVQLEELNQIAEAFPGVNPIEILAEGIGQSVPDFTAALSQPGGALKAFGLTGEQAVDILIEGFTKNVPGAMGAMDRQALTLNGTLSTLKDTLQGIAIDTLTPLLPGISASIRKAIPTIERIAQEIPGAIQAGISLASRGIDFFRDAFSEGTIGEGLTRVFNGIGAKIDQLFPLVMPALDRAVQAIADFIVTQGPDIFRALRDGFFQFVNWVATEFWPTVLPYLLQWLGQLQAWATGTAAPAIAEWVKAWAAAFVDWVLAVALPWLAERLGQLLAWFGQWVADSAQALAAQVVAWAVALTEWVPSTAVPWLIGHTAELLAWFIRWIGDAAGDIAAKCVELALALTDWVVRTAIPWLLDGLGRFLGAIVGWIAGAAGAIAGHVVHLANALLSFASNAAARVGGALEAVAGAIFGWINGMAGRIASAASGMWDGIYESFRSAINAVIGAWNGLSFTLPTIDVDWNGPLPGGNMSAGGQTFGTPNVSYLASGGVVTSPTLAMLAEVPSAQPEIVTPERLMRQVVLDAINEASTTDPAGDIYVDQHIYLDSKPIQRSLARLERSGR